MKKLLLLLFITLSSCGTLPTTSGISGFGYINGWAHREMPPSQVVTNGDMFYESKLSDGRTFSVGGYIGDPDSTYYYNALMQDLGWYKDMDGDWESYNATRTKRGHLYINIKRGVAIYMYSAEKTFNCFKVTINPKEDN